MIRVVFKNMHRSDLAKEAVKQRLTSVVFKFPDLRHTLMHVTLEMKNSPTQPGPDLFTIACHIYKGRYQGLRVEKSGTNLYGALHDLVDHLLYKLNTHGDRVRVRERAKARRLLNPWLLGDTGN